MHINSKAQAEPYKALNRLSPTTKRIIEQLNARKVYRGLYSAIARELGVSRCVVWQIATRLASKERST